MEMRGEKNADNGFAERIERISACQICPDVPNPFNPLPESVFSSYPNIGSLGISVGLGVGSGRTHAQTHGNSTSI